MARNGKNAEFKQPKITKDQILARTHSTRAEAAEFLGIEDQTLYRYCIFYGIPSSAFVKNYNGDDITLKEMLTCKGMSVEKASRNLGVSRPVVRRIMDWYKIESFI